MHSNIDFEALQVRITHWAEELGFDGLGVSDVDLSADEAHLLNWLDDGRHGQMAYMARHGTKRSRPADLVPDTIRVIAVKMHYWPGDAARAEDILEQPEVGYVSRYALGRDYHKVMRRRLQKLADRIESEIGPFGYRAFVDSAPVLEKALARKAGLGWIGKHTNLLNREHGSYFFLGELYTNLPLPTTSETQEHCGRCTACIDVCPTNAIVAPYQLDARLCISYLTIEHFGPIPLELRSQMGNRIYGCDDCQLVCPWNRFAAITREPDFAPRHRLDAPGLVALLEWSEGDFNKYTEGSAIRRIGFERWQRNVAVALGNAPADPGAIAALKHALASATPLVREHVQWAIEQQEARSLTVKTEGKPNE
ncbi:MAG: tRNA epoxyqueuosine(34) reductase QueG [Gammaproteobacteria bacterium]|nr:tRNA epoxyqueuosine(34) reductase QueG [Gammaproteobacteria bacterium]